MKKLRKSIAVIGIFCLTLWSLPGLTESYTKEEAEIRYKDEVVYGSLYSDGKRDRAYVVNVFEVVKPGWITDYGNYQQVKNLSDLSPLDKRADQIEWLADSGKFYYQGDLESYDLPWDISIQYRLNGKEVDAEDLLGQSGQFQMTIQTKQAEEVDPLFYEHYMLQINLAFDTEKFSNIQAEDATITNIGKEEQVSFSLLPEKDADFSLTAQVNDFEFTGVEFVGIPLVMVIDELDTGNMVDQFQELNQAIDQVHQGISQLSDGLQEMNQGSGQLYTGSEQFKEGLTKLSHAATPLVKASKEIKEGLHSLTGNWSLASIDLAGIEAFGQGLEDIRQGISQLADELEQVSKQTSSVFQELEKILHLIPDRDPSLELSEDEIAGLSQLISQEKLAYLRSQLEGAKGLKDFFSNQELAFFWSNLGRGLDEASQSLRAIAEALQDLNQEWTASMEGWKELEQLFEMEANFEQFKSHYERFHQGLADYSQGVQELAHAYPAIHQGIGQLVKGTDDLADGSMDLKEGTGQLRDETIDLPEEMQEEIDQYLADYQIEDFEARSFISPKNKSIGSVQFILKTEAIQHADEPDPNDRKEEKKGFFEMLKALFFN